MVREQVRPRADAMARAALDDEDLVQWPPAAKVTRAKAPAVSTAAASAGEATTPRRGPIMGAIMERTSAEASSAHPTASLDEKPMSAFRRSRLLRAQGQAPDRSRPLASSTSAIAEREKEASPLAMDPTRDPGGGAGPDALSSLMHDISEENERKIASMNYETMEDELRDAEAFFGKDILARLSARRQASAHTTNYLEWDPGHAAESDEVADQPARPTARTPDVAQGAASSTSRRPPQGWPSLERLAEDVDTTSAPPAAPSAPPPAAAQTDLAEQATLQSLHDTYFPDEPDVVPPALEWTVTSDSPSSHVLARFDFHGHLTNGERTTWSEAPDATYLAGLHHHGSDPHTPGYTLDELLHLARSHVASQRIMALQILERIVRTYPLQEREREDGMTAHLAYQDLEAEARRRRASILYFARWLLDDRHRSVRKAAGECLASAVQSVSMVPSHALALTSNPLWAEPDLNWLWHASRSASEAWSCHAQAPAFHHPDASPLEMWQHNWAAALLVSNVYEALSTWLEQDETAGPTVVRLVYGLVTHSNEAGTTLPRWPRLVHALVSYGLTKYAWPLGDMPWPMTEAMVALYRCVQSSRAAAQALVEQGALDPMLRYILLPPQDVLTGSASSKTDYEHTLACLALRTLAVLGRFRCLSVSVREIWSALPRWAQWASTQFASMPSAEDVRLATMRALFDVFEAWTHAAIVAPKHGDLGVNWPLVESWGALACDMLRLPPTTLTTTSSAAALGVYAAALRHVGMWLDAACALQVDTSSMLSTVTSLESSMTRWADLLDTLLTPTQALALTSQRPVTVHHTASHLTHVASMLGGLTKVLRYTQWPKLETRVIAWKTALLQWPLSNLVTPAMRDCGIVPAQHAWIVAHCCSDTTPELQLASVRTMTGTEGAMARTWLEKIVKAVDPEVWSVLSPFFLANMPPINDTSMLAALRYDVEDVPSLCLPGPSPWPLPMDPQTEAELWRSPAAGLPLRRDWAWLALDDLLHSAEAVALNARDALPPSWDYSEAQIVESTLQLVEAVAHYDDLPSAFLWLGLQKIFLLEASPASTPQATGAATGRDLYARPSIAQRMRSVIEWANKHASQRPQPTLEEAALQVHGTAVPYYQMYTDLIGLYEAISMNDPLFAQVLLPPLAMIYPVDYRRLVWSDYASLLPGITIKSDQAPVVRGERLEAYLWPCETDAMVLAHYADALVAKRVGTAQPFLYAIALHHVSAALWHDKEVWGAPLRLAPTLQASLAQQIWSPSTPSSIPDALLAYEPKKGAPFDVDARRAQLKVWGIALS